MTEDAVCRDYRPDHNGECLNCDEPAEAHALALLDEVLRLRAEKRCDFPEHLEMMVDVSNLVLTLSEVRAENEWLRLLVDAVGENVCKLALRQQKKLAAHDQPSDPDK